MPEDRLEHEIELRFTSDLRRLDYAALFDQSGKLQYGNVVAIPEGLADRWQVPHRRDAEARGDDAGTEPVVFVAGQRQDGGIVLLGRSLYEVDALRQVVLQALMIVHCARDPSSARHRDNIQFARRPPAQDDQRNDYRIMQGDLQERLPAHGKMDDLNSVASAVNLMLDEIGRLLNQLKSVGDNIAHDLPRPAGSHARKLERGLAGANPIRTCAIAAKRALDLDQALATVSALLRRSR